MSAAEYLASIEERERGEFEAFMERKAGATAAHFRRAPSGKGAYLNVTVDSAWTGWLARSVLAEADQEPSAVAARTFRQIQIHAAAALPMLKEGTTEWDLVANIHRDAASALTIKSAGNSAADSEPPPPATA